MERLYIFVIALLLFSISALSFAGDLKKSMPGQSEKFDSQANTPNQTSHTFGVDSQGNTSVLTPNNSGGYIGIDSQGSAVTITPLRGQLGVDSQGNIWTIRPR